MKKGEKTTIWVGEDTKTDLDKLKIIEQEPYDMIVRKLIKFFKDNRDGELPKLEESA